jgi:hypothetical protein
MTPLLLVLIIRASSWIESASVGRLFGSGPAHSVTSLGRFRELGFFGGRPLLFAPGRGFD